MSTRPIAILTSGEGLGDALVKLPFLRAVRRGFPDSPVWWIAWNWTSLARELSPFVRDLVDHVIETPHLMGSARTVKPWLQQLPPFEKVFDTRTRIASVALARSVLDHRGYFSCLPGYILSDARPPSRRTRPRNLAERMLTMAEAALGRPGDWQGGLAVSPAARTLAAQRLPEGPTYIGLAVGSREARKNWPLQRYIALANRLGSTGRTPVFLIGPQEQAMLAELRAAVPGALFPETEPVDPALGIARLEFAIAVCQRLTAAVANDSGVGHLLAAADTPLVSLFGPSDAVRWAPFAQRIVVIRAKEFGGTTMKAIPVDAAQNALERLLAAR